jgi:hypothetical protein
MDFIAVGEQARGFIAIGQHATGVFAFGQVATGVVAVGQLARGCFCLGQAAIGFIGWGQLGLGIFHAVGMLGAGGRGAGIVLPLTPSLGKKRVPPATTTLEMVYAGHPGWLKLDLFFDGNGIGFGSGGQRLPIKVHRKVVTPAGRLVTHGEALSVWAYVRRIGQTLVCERVVHEPPRPYEEPGFFARGAFQFLGLMILACVWWLAVGNELLVILAELAGS